MFIFPSQLEPYNLHNWNSIIKKNNQWAVQPYYFITFLHWNHYVNDYYRTAYVLYSVYVLHCRIIGACGYRFCIVWKYGLNEWTSKHKGIKRWTCLTGNVWALNYKECLVTNTCTVLYVLLLTNSCFDDDTRLLCTYLKQVG
jgi:hypothetical protein